MINILNILKSIGMFLVHYWFVSLIILAIIIIIIRNIVRGYSWKDKYGNELTIKEFFKSWGRGIEGITPIQQSITNMLGTWIIISGVIAGIIINALVRMKNQWWWIEVVLIGSLIVTIIQMIGIYQKFRRQKKVKQEMDELDNIKEEQEKPIENKIKEYNDSKELLEDLQEGEIEEGEIVKLDERETITLEEDRNKLREHIVSIKAGDKS